MLEQRSADARIKLCESAGATGNASDDLGVDVKRTALPV